MAPRIASGRPVQTETDRERVTRQIVAAYSELAAFVRCADGSRAVSLGPFGRVEIRLTEMPLQTTGPTIPPLWIEVLSRTDGSTIDGYGFFELGGEDLTAAVDFILEASRHHPHHG